MKPQSDNLEDYLKVSKYVNYDNPNIKELAKRLVSNCSSKPETARCIYEYVRDEINHSWDIHSSTVSVTASDVLENGHGLCYAKSNLLAALLRSQGIPAGFCYQKLTLYDTPESGYVIHALNAVYIEDIRRWIRIDARGNKDGVDARFSLEKEQLAFPVRKEIGELDYETIFTDPSENTMKALENSTDVLELYEHNLPTEI